MSETIKNKKLNFRDLGGMRTKDGRTIRKGLILRSAKLNKLSAHDKAVLEKKYKVNTVIDLRSDAEREGRADILPDGAEYYHIPYFNESTLAVTGGMGSDVLEAVKKAESKDELYNYIPELTDVYPIVVTDEYAVSQLSQALKIIMSNRDGAVLFHCTAGKDRTGITSAVLMKILGICDEQIMQDYTETNKVSRKNARKYSLIACIFLASKKIAKKTYEVFLADEKYLDSAFDALTVKYGSFENFVRDALKISDEEIAEFKDYILEPLNPCR
jgi:protein-tyrosine phosphatase